MAFLLIIINYFSCLDLFFFNFLYPIPCDEMIKKNLPAPNTKIQSVRETFLKRNSLDFFFFFFRRTDVANAWRDSTWDVDFIFIFHVCVISKGHFHVSCSLKIRQ